MTGVRLEGRYKVLLHVCEAVLTRQPLPALTLAYIITVSSAGALGCIQKPSAIVILP